MANPSGRNWFKTIIHFVFGVLVGVLVGILIWTRLHKRGGTEPLSLESGWMLIGGSALGFGLAAAVFADRFWGQE